MKTPKKPAEAQNETPPPPTQPNNPTRVREEERAAGWQDRCRRANTKAERQALFLEAYAVIGNVGQSAIDTGIDRGTHYDWMKEEGSDYPNRFATANEAFIDLIRETIRQKAVLGWNQALTDRYGNLIGYQERFSERLLERLAEAKCPEFRKKTEISGPEGQPLKIQVMTGVPQPEGK